jgi:hypothetical protein
MDPLTLVISILSVVVIALGIMFVNEVYKNYKARRNK